MMNFITVSRILAVALLFSCSTANKNYSPVKKFPGRDLRQDYTLLRNILEKKHPSLYWYTPKDSMDTYFDTYYNYIADSMTEQQFAWQILAPLVSKIHCGHTSVSLSKAYGKWAEGRRFPSFPLSFKVWEDSMAVTGNLNRKDSIFKRGTIVTSINHTPHTVLVKKMFEYLPKDGYADIINYIRLSVNFPYYHRNIFGISKEYTVGYLDSTGVEKFARLPLYMPPKDSTKKDSLLKNTPLAPKITAQKKREALRSLEIDSTGKFAVMRLNTFSKGGLRGFFRRSFRELRKKNIGNLVLDIRLNGGGKVVSSTLLTRYITRQPFRIADTLFAVSKSLKPYTKHVKGSFLNNIELFFICRKKSDGLYHIRHMEKSVFRPKSSNHYNGKVYVLIGGPTFSAAALFANAVKGQPGITLVGEETGGGWYGNNGIMIPDIILPHTKTRVRLPLFRLVQYNHVAQKGTGVMPDILVPTSYDALIKGYDKKLRFVKELISRDE
jgi:hypothetical protein